jgi:hypothetical protein
MVQNSVQYADNHLKEGSITTIKQHTLPNNLIKKFSIMKKMKYFPLLLLFSYFSVGSQNTWNQLVPLVGLSPNQSYVGARQQGNNLLLSGNQRFLELSDLGEITGYRELPNYNLYNNFIARKTDASTGEMLFLVGGRKISTNSPYVFTLVDANQGVINEFSTPELLPSAFNTAAPPIAELDDSTLVMFGAQNVYKIRWTKNGINLLWQTPMVTQNLTITDAVKHNNGFVIFSSTGHIIGLDNNGQHLFTQLSLQAENFKAATWTADGVLTCGISNQQSFISKFDFLGNQLWKKQFDFLNFNDILLKTNGHIVVCGETLDGLAAFHETDASGNSITTKTYQAGKGISLFTNNTGGLKMVVQSSPQRKIFIINTDAVGIASAPNTFYEIENRFLKTLTRVYSLYPNGGLFFQPNLQLIDSLPTTLSNLAPWLSATDVAGNLHLMAETYPFGGHTDLFNGIINGSNNDYKQVWRAKKSEIQALREDFLSDHVLQGPVPSDLLTWPGRGNPNIHYNLDFSEIETDRELQPAPFVDFNNDGIYNVYDGDYPLIKGDQMVWWMLNDDGMHGKSNGQPLLVDLIFSVYSYDCGETDLIENSIFVDLQVINRSTNDYEEAHLGFFTDFDLGCYLDDYVGTMPQSNTYFSYNKDEEDTLCGTTPSFENNIPVQTITFQNQSLDHSIVYHNLGVGTPNQAQTDPVLPIEYQHYLQAIWRDGTPQTVGASGYNPGSLNQSNHAYSGNPSIPTEWSMCTSNQPLTDDRTLIR